MFLAEINEIDPKLRMKYVLVEWHSDTVLIKYSLKNEK